MKKNSKKANLFVVDTIFQLLNAIEAANTFNLSNNHLIIVSVEGPTRDAYAPLVEKMQWASVRYLAYKDIYKDVKEIEAFGPKTKKLYTRWYGWYLQFIIIRRLARLTCPIKDIDNLFLGHYWVEYKFFMRHFANTLKYKTLYLIDDGTDTIDINDRRKRIDLNANTALSKSTADGTAILSRLKRYLREKYLDWRTEDAASITFFTSYDLDVRAGDHLIKNEYAYLRSLATAMKRVEEVYFIGDCLVEDGDMSETIFFEYLRKIKLYFDGERVVYISHPRQSMILNNKIVDRVGIDVKKFDYPLEYELMVRGPIPKILATFCSSAIESCAIIFGEQVDIKSFYVYPQHFLRLKDNYEGMYKYFEKTRVGRNFSIIKLPMDDAKLAGNDIGVAANLQVKDMSAIALNSSNEQ